MELFVDGSLMPISRTGSLTLDTLPLNRPQLVAHRQHKLNVNRRMALVAEIKVNLQAWERVCLTRLEFSSEHKALLDEYCRLLEIFLGNVE